MMLQTLITVCQTTVKARRVHIMRKLEKQIGVTCYCNHIKCGESEVWESRVPLVITTKRQMWIFLSSWQLILIANPIWHEYTLTPDCRAARQAAVGNGRVALDSCEYVERIWSEGLITKVTRLPVCKHRKRVAKVRTRQRNRMATVGKRCPPVRCWWRLHLTPTHWAGRKVSCLVASC